MKDFRLFLLALPLVVVAPLAPGYRAWALGDAPSGQTVAPKAGHRYSFRIVSPRPNEELAPPSVTVRYRHLAPASVTPSYELRVDGRDPVRTTETAYTFRWLTPGAHRVVVQMVNAHGRPVGGARSEVKFAVTSSAVVGGIAGIQASSLPELPLPRPPVDFPGGNSSLPLLSVIGFGILVGGLISTLRTRAAPK